jgi:hypothetical protein
MVNQNRFLFLFAFLRVHLRLKHLARCSVPERWRPIGYLTHLVRSRCRQRVRHGPFAGMRYIDGSIGSAYLPKLLGTYERELVSVIEAECVRRPRLIIDLGAAEGYYAVGLALRNPGARVVAFERGEAGQIALLKMARLNGVPGRLEIRGGCGPSDLRDLLDSGKDEHPRVANPNPFILCDVEGDERRLLDPSAIPGLQSARILVETHEFIHPGITEQLRARFAPTHGVELIWQTSRLRSDFPFRGLGTWLLPKSYLAWAVSEWRPCRMCWLWMRPHD